MSNLLKYTFIALLLVGSISSCKNKEEASAQLSITDFSPEEAIPGAEMTIIGTGFSTSPTENSVISGVEALEAEGKGVKAEVLQASNTRLIVKVPDNAPKGKISIFIAVNGGQFIQSTFRFEVADIVISGKISGLEGLTLLGNRRYLLDGPVVVEAGSKVTIQPGAIIKGRRVSKGCLIIEQGAKIFAEGTASNPIVFTTDQPGGTPNGGAGNGAGRDYRDWPGLVILGKAPNSQGSNITFKQLPDALGLTHGGSDAEDNSGVLKHVRIEFVGNDIVKDSSLAGLTLASVGRGTTIEYIQVSYAHTDAFRFIGGTVNAKYLIAFSTKEDDFDISLGYKGKIQYALANRDPYISSFDALAEGVDVRGEGTELTLANYTYLGARGAARGGINPPEGSGKNNGGVYITKGAKLSMYNSVVIGSIFSGISMDKASLGFYNTDANSFPLKGNAVLLPTLSTLPTNVSFTGEFGVVLDIQSNGNFRYANYTDVSPTDAEVKAIRDLFRDLANTKNQVTYSGGGIGILEGNQLGNLPALAANEEPLLLWGITNMGAYVLNNNGASFNTPLLAPGTGKLLSGNNNVPLPNDNFFENAAFKGAFGGQDWSAGWANYNPRIADY